jgi:hypothetical protein
MRWNVIILTLIFWIGIQRNTTSAQEPFSLRLEFDRNSYSECEPIFFRLRLSNDSDSEAWLEDGEWFDLRTGPLYLRYREEQSSGPREYLRLYNERGHGLVIGGSRRSIEPKACLDWVDLFIPARFIRVDRDSHWEFTATFDRTNKSVLFADPFPLKIALAPVNPDRDACVVAGRRLVESRFSWPLSPAEENAFSVAMDRFPALARLGKIYFSHQNLLKHRVEDAAFHAELKNFVRDMGKLPALEREGMAYKIAYDDVADFNDQAYRDVGHALVRDSISHSLLKLCGQSNVRAKSLIASRAQRLDTAERYREIHKAKAKAKQ